MTSGSRERRLAATTRRNAVGAGERDLEAAAETRAVDGSDLGLAGRRAVRQRGAGQCAPSVASSSADLQADSMLMSAPAMNESALLLKSARRRLNALASPSTLPQHGLEVALQRDLPSVFTLASGGVEAHHADAVS
jgi:hypothetical protein